MTVKIPVIIDTDIGTDIDDMWAIAFCLNCPELDIKLITTTTGDTTVRAKIVGQLLKIAGREDIPIALGPHLPEPEVFQDEWVSDFELSDYAGPVYTDAVRAMIETLNASAETPTIISIAPLPNIAKTIEQCPDIPSKTNFVGMHGSIRRGYHGRAGAAAEYNIKSFVRDAQRVFSSPWRSMTIAPLDTCGTIILRDENLKKILNSKKPLVKALIACNKMWLKRQRFLKKPVMLDHCTTSLYDTLAVYLAFAENAVNIEELKLSVTDEGFTAVDEKGIPVRVAASWRSIETFNNFLTERLLA